jgi:hypothetical protein
MHMNEYVLEVLTRERLADMRAEAARSRRIAATNQASWPLREELRVALVRLGLRVRSVLGRVLTIGRGETVKSERTSTHGALRG